MVKHLERSRDLFLANQTEGFHLGVELNTDFFVSDCYTDYFKRQYAEYLCMLHEKGVPISIGSDLHSNYTAHHEQIRHYMDRWASQKIVLQYQGCTNIRINPNSQQRKLILKPRGVFC